jgi:sugar phosphate isomerase/epimerase
VEKRQFGVSTHLYHHQRLCRAHLLEIAAHGFETVEVVATRTHFDYHNPAAVADLQQWLAGAGLTLSSLHAPVAESCAAGRWSGWLSLASSDPGERERAVVEAEHALHVARRIPVRVFVVHLGAPRALQRAGGDSRASARRSLEELHRVAEPLGVRIAVEILPNELSRAGSLAHVVEVDLRKADLVGAPVGIGFDIGHAHLEGDVGEALEVVSEHVLTVDVHDNGGRIDDHLVPFEGTVDWPAALTAVQKIGFDGPLMFEVGGRGPAKDILARARRARGKMERMMAT